MKRILALFLLAGALVACTSPKDLSCFDAPAQLELTDWKR